MGFWKDLVDAVTGDNDGKSEQSSKQDPSSVTSIVLTRPSIVKGSSFSEVRITHYPSTWCGDLRNILRYLDWNGHGLLQVTSYDGYSKEYQIKGEQCQ